MNDEPHCQCPHPMLVYVKNFQGEHILTQSTAMSIAIMSLKLRSAAKAETATWPAVYSRNLGKEERTWDQGIPDKTGDCVIKSFVNYLCGSVRKKQITLQATSVPGFLSFPNLVDKEDKIEIESGIEVAL